MSKDIKYTEGEIISFKEVEDFLPPPEQLVRKHATKKITLSVRDKSFQFFKEKAKELGVPYQRMIRNLLDEYVAAHAKNDT